MYDTIQNVVLSLCMMLVCMGLLISPIKGNVGVKVGNWATYKIQALAGNATEGNERMLARVNETNSIQWINVTVEKISDDRVKILEITHFENGTSNSIPYEGSIRSPGDLRYWIIAGGLRKDDLISTEENLTVRGTYSEEYANITRFVNQGFLEIRRLEMNQLQTVEFYWDQETGILCRSLSTYMIVSESSGEVTVAIMISLINTNAWKTDFGSYGRWLVAVAITVVTVSIVAFKLIVRKKSKKRRSR